MITVRDKPIWFYEEFEDTKGEIKIRKSNKDRHHNGQKKKGKKTSNDIQNTTQRKRSRNTNPTKKPGVDSGAH
jgi:hypothetical protein